MEEHSPSDSKVICTCVVCDLLKRGFSQRILQEKNDILTAGRPMVPINLETKVDKSVKKFTRHFHVGFYKKYEWLTGCAVISKLFCWPCLLFSSSEKTHWNSVGVTDLNNFHKSLKRHVNSKAHINSTVKEKLCGMSQIENSLDNRLKVSHKRHNELVKKNRDILNQLIDVTCFLGQRELTFRGDTESEDSGNRGNYVDLLELLGKYDENLRNHLRESIIFRYTSNRIQNDLIRCTVHVVSNFIKDEVRKASFVSIILDETTDINHSRQLSVIVRYLKSDGIIQERFLKFIDVSADPMAETMFHVVCDIVEDLECGSKLVAQSYDESAVLAGLQVEVKEKYKNALFVHYFAHRLNLVLSQGLRNIDECKIFFSTLSGMASFLSKSPRRTCALDTYVQKRFPNVAPTQWTCNGRLVQTVFQYREVLIDFFQDIWNNKVQWDAETVTATKGYLHWLQENFDFNFLLNIFAEIFPQTDMLFDMLQTESNDVDFCVKRIDDFQEQLVQKRDQFEHFWDKIADLALEPERKRIKIEDDERKASYCRLYFEILDNITQQLRSRFLNVTELKFVELCNFHSYTTSQFPTDTFNSLALNYGNFFDLVALRSQLSVVYETSEITDKKTPLDILMFLKNAGLENSLGEVVKLCELVLTIPITNASSDKRSFSILERIERFMRNSTSVEELSNLALLSIEKEYVKELSQNPKFYDDIKDTFAAVDKRIELKYR